MLDTEIELMNLADSAIKLITCPDTIFSPTEAAEFLSRKSGKIVTASMFMAFRAKFVKGQVNLAELPRPIVPQTEVLGSARNIRELMAYSQLDTLGLRNGVVAEAFEIFKDAKDNEKYKDALTALRLIMDGSESIDKKLKAIAGDDPAAEVLSSEAFRGLKEALLAIHRDNPDFDLMGKIKQAVKESQDANGTAIKPVDQD